MDDDKAAAIANALEGLHLNQVASELQWKN